MKPAVISDGRDSHRFTCPDDEGIPVPVSAGKEWLKAIVSVQPQLPSERKLGSICQEAGCQEPDRRDFSAQGQRVRTQQRQRQQGQKVPI
ncbi:hypothetical protein HPB47_010591 [Ixodes persulcatus]|uniref:Uncharacterized protein n=1 Tax=Ixodes persulcatus TaxID=34615 RepID=A0AC60NYN6_IXOPE|nr:hypothetical protein HPB47_010591 [Ixodes persulcatus]